MSKKPGEGGITNTEKLSLDNPGAILAETILFGPSRAVELMEKHGQAELTKSSCLPSELRLDSKHRLLELGVKFVGDVEGDPLFQKVEMPSGWKIVPTEHDMWSELRDDKDRLVGSIFYKAAFYDRRAHFSFNNEYVK